MKAKLECIRNDPTADCNVETFCDETTDEQAINTVKQERCWDDGRKYCVVNIFKGTGPIGECFSNIACACNVDCTDYCLTQKKISFQACNVQSCGCTENIDSVLERQDDYFSQDLLPVSND